MTSTTKEPANNSNRISSGRHHSHVVLPHMIDNLPRLHTSTNTGRASGIWTRGVFGQVLKLFQVVRPDTQRTSSSTSSTKIMARVPTDRVRNPTFQLCLSHIPT